MDKDTLISIIAPVYNKEKYLDRSINSILNQTWKNLEIVVINDGSTDNSLQILENMQSKDSRIKIYSQENSGLCSAVCSGIEKATGKYICFMDSDDWIGPNFVTNFYERIEDYDFVAMGYYYVTKNSQTVSCFGDFSINNKDEIKEIRDNYITKKGCSSWANKTDVSRVNKMYKTSVVKPIVKDLKLCQDINMSEDSIFSFLMLGQVQSFKVCSEPNEYYYDCANEDSITNNKNFDSFRSDALNGFDKLKFFTEKYDSALQQPYFLFYLTMNCYLQSLLDDKKFNLWYKYRVQLWKDPVFKKAIELNPAFENQYTLKFAKIFGPKLYFKLASLAFRLIL